MTAHVWVIPPPLEGPPALIMRRFQAASGMTLDAHGVADSLTLAAWRQIRGELRAGDEPLGSARAPGPVSASLMPAVVP